jgi:hypothetical protein
MQVIRDATAGLFLDNQDTRVKAMLFAQQGMVRVSKGVTQATHTHTHTHTYTHTHTLTYILIYIGEAPAGVPLDGRTLQALGYLYICIYAHVC